MVDTALLASQQIALIGRDTIIHDILQAPHAKRPVFIFLQGEGGIGKTALLHAIQKQASGMRCRHIIDLYHLEYQTPEGFAWAVQELLPDINFGQFKKHYEDLQRARDSHDEQAVTAVWQKAQKAWLGALNSQLRLSPVWLFLDTLEVLSLPETDQEKENLLGWLTRIFQELTGPVIWLAAGRPSDVSHYIFRHIPQHYRKWAPTLNYLSEAESLEYLQKTAAQLAPRDPRGVKKIQEYLETWGISALYQQTDGKPLRLAIVTDVLRTGSSLPGAFYQKPTQKKESDETLDMALVEYLSRLDSPLGEIIQTMALLRKGIDAQLLAQVMQITPEEAQSFLHEAEKLTLVKKRPGDDITRPYFLHDEIYDLFNRYRPLAEPARSSLFTRLEAYYNEEISRWRNALKEFSPLRFRYLKRWRLAQIERMHYALWLNGLRGYADYFVLRHDITASGDTSASDMIFSEARVTRGLCKKFNMRIPLVEQYFEIDEKLQAIENLLSKDVTLAQQKMKAMVKMDWPPFLKAYWHYLYALVGIRLGQRSMSTYVLDTPIASSLQEALKLAETVHEPELAAARQALLSYADNYLGYQNRREGKYQVAHRYYQESAARMRQLGLSGTDGVLVNQAYAMSMLGYDRRAYETAREAAELSQQSNDLRGQIRALNVMAFVVLRTGQPERANAIIEKALKLLPQISNDDRLRGMVLITKAMAGRQTWNQVVADNLVDWRQEWGKNLAPALAALEGKEYVQEKLGLRQPASARQDKSTLKNELEKGAIALLKERDAENLTIAQNESGNCWREIAWAIRDLPQNDEQQRRRYELAAQLARTRFLQACGIEREKEDWTKQIREQTKRIGGSPYWPIAALVNLAWHEHYMHADTDIPGYQKIIQEIIGAEYLWPPQISPEEGEIQRWVVLGKFEMLCCFIALRQWEAEQKNEYLRSAMRSAALSLEYNYRIGQTSYDLRRAEISLETRLRGTKDWETKLLPAFYKAAQEVEDEFRPHLPKGKTARLLHWLRERFGEYHLWKDAG